MKIDAIKPTAVVRQVGTAAKAANDGGTDFGKLLSAALDNVNQLQTNAAKASIDLAAGTIQDISQVTIASEKAAIALQLTMQVRNKVVEAYQEMMRMQV